MKYNSIGSKFNKLVLYIRITNREHNISFKIIMNPKKLILWNH